MSKILRALGAAQFNVGAASSVQRWTRPTRRCFGVTAYCVVITLVPQANSRPQAHMMGLAQ